MDDNIKEPNLDESSSKEPKWYVVHTYSGYENKVKKDLEHLIENRELQDCIFQIVVPMEEQIEIKDGQRKTKIKKVYPGYAMIKMIITEETWYIVRNTTGVTGFVGGGNPIPLSDKEVRHMGFEDLEIIVDYEVGDTVEILSDPLKGYIGQVEAINKDKQKVKILISMFGRDTSTELDFSQIQKVIK